jgi:hypothetical protein
MSYEKAAEQRAIDWDKIMEQTLTMPGNTGNVYNRFYEHSFLNRTCAFKESRSRWLL